MPNEFIAKRGFISSGNAQVTGSLVVTAGITGSLYGTASWASNAISTQTASIAVNSLFASSSAFSTQSLNATNSLTAVSATSSLTSQTASISINGLFASSSAFSTQSRFATQSLFATSSITASYALGMPTIKAGIVSGSAFSGSSRSASVTFTTAFPNTIYSVVVTGDNARTWTITQKSGSRFFINSNSAAILSGSVYWQAMSIGEYYS